VTIGLPGTALRSAIIGAGFIGEVHARAVRACGGQVVAVVSSTPEGSAAAAVRLGATRSARTVEELVSADDIDVVHVCTPNDVHAELTLSAISAGKHVICEKPLATDLDTARRLSTAADERGVVAAVPFVYRFYPTVRDARERVRHGETGPLRLLHGSYLQDWLAEPHDNNWRVDPSRGGESRAFADIGVHWCDLVEFTTGHRIRQVSARLVTTHAQRHGPGQMESVATEDVALVQFDTDLGAVGSVVVSQVTHGRKNRLWFSLDGDLASLSFDQEHPDSLWIGGRDRTTLVTRGGAPAGQPGGRYNILPAGHPQGYQDCFNAFVADVYAAVSGAIPDGLPTFADGLRAAAVTHAVVESHKREAWVEVL
jgi:predicted dehydrogenase